MWSGKVRGKLANFSFKIEWELCRGQKVKDQGHVVIRCATSVRLHAAGRYNHMDFFGCK